MALTSNLYPKVRLHAEGVPTPVMDRYIIDVVRFFCTESLTYRETLNDIAVSAGTAEYNMTASAAAEEVVQPLYAEFVDSDGSVHNLNPTTDEILRSAVESWRNRQGTPALYFAPSVGRIRLFPEPDVAGTIHDLQVVKRPIVSTTTVPDYLYESWEMELADGAAGRILMVPGKKWSNWTVGYRLWKMFVSDVRDVRRKVRAGLTGAPLQVVIPKIT